MASSKKKQVRPRCWFCDGEGSSLEHVLAQWLREVLPLAENQRFVHSIERVPGRRELKLAKRPAFHTRKFCKTCNNGFMSALEQEVQPVLAPLVKGEARLLTRDTQLLLATWATKTMLTWQSMEPDDLRVVDRALYREFFRTRRPLTGSQVWLGANAHGEPGWQRGHTLHLAPPLSGAGFGVTLSVGHAVFHVAWTERREARLDLRGQIADALAEIWPSGQDRLVWPPRARFAGHDLTDLAQTIADHSKIETLTAL